MELDQKNCSEKRSLDCKASWKLGREFQVCSFGESSSRCFELVSGVPAFESHLIHALVREPNKCSSVHQIGHWCCCYFFLFRFLSGVNCVALPQETSVTQPLPPKWGSSRTRMSCGSLTACFRLQVERHATEGKQPKVGASEEGILIQPPLLF